MPGKRKGSPEESSPKTVLRLPDLDHAKRTVLDSLGSPDSARAYAFAMYSFIAWYCSSLDWLSASTSSCGNELSWSPSAVGYHMATDKVRYRSRAPAASAEPTFLRADDPDTMQPARLQIALICPSG